MNHDDTGQVTGLADEPAPDEKAELDPPVSEPKDDQVPPSGVLPPDPTGLGALA